jgi:predicted PurR-regulated permease PerM
MQTTLKNKNYLIFSLIFIVLSFFIMETFMSGIIWGAVTALSVWPIFDTICKKDFKFLKHTVGENAFLFALIFSLIFIIPFIYSIFELSNVYILISDYISTNTSQGIIHSPKFFEILPMHNKIISLWDTYISHSSSLLELFNKIGTGELFTLFTHIWSGLINRIITVFVMIISFYFMLKNGEHIKKYYKSIFEYWIGPESVTQIDNGIESLRGTINGIVLIGIVEGLALSIPLIMGGVPSGFLIALCAGILGVIPLLMPVLIAPCLAFLYFSGETTWAIIGTVDLVLIWFIFENIIKPQVISKKVKINTFIILISMIGGMQLLGPLGLFIGPAIVSMAIGMIQELITQTKPQEIIKE